MKVFGLEKNLRIRRSGGGEMVEPGNAWAY